MHTGYDDDTPAQGSNIMKTLTCEPSYRKEDPFASGMSTITHIYVMLLLFIFLCYFLVAESSNVTDTEELPNASSKGIGVHAENDAAQLATSYTGRKKDDRLNNLLMKDENEDWEKAFQEDCAKSDKLLKNYHVNDTGKQLELSKYGKLSKTKDGEYYFKNKLDAYWYLISKHDHMNVYDYFTTRHLTKRVNNADDDVKLPYPHPLREYNTYQLNPEDFIGVLIGPTWPNMKKGKFRHELHTRMCLSLFKHWGNFEGQKKLKPDAESWVQSFDKFINDLTTSSFVKQNIINT